MSEQSTQNKKILVIEDERSMLKLLNERLTSEGFEVMEATNGEEGLGEALKTHPALILLDIRLPKMDGITFLKKLRKDDWGKQVPVVVLTNVSDTKTAAEALEEGAYDFLVKTDLKLEDVVTKVKERLSAL